MLKNNFLRFQLNFNLEAYQSVMNRRITKSKLNLSVYNFFMGGIPGLVVMGQLVFKRSWVRIPAPYTGWTFVTFICCKNCVVCLKKTEYKRKRGRGWPILFLKTFFIIIIMEVKFEEPRLNGGMCTL